MTPQTARPLRGQVALVTGGGGGLGSAICRMLGAEDAVAVVADVLGERAERTANEVRAAGGAAEALALDVTCERSVEEALRGIAARHGRLDILVNNAGVDVTLPVDELSVADWDRIAGVNLRGPFLLARKAFPTMKRQGYGQIVNIVSTAGKRTWANASAYHASKWGLLGLSHALHVEGRAVGIRVTAIVAGGMRTEFLFGRFPDLDPGLLQDPENVANAIRFALTQPEGTVVPELTVLPMRETSWP
jgi:NAD(P)-dependent dehydrogenase (short-subunit alcohol dehydrogenase family)